MYSIDNYIDTIQNTKKTVTKQLVSDETLQSTLVGMIDAQTTVAKTITNDFIKSTKQFNDNVWSVMKSFTKSA
jgi:hypothetical protein